MIIPNVTFLEINSVSCEILLTADVADLAVKNTSLLHRCFDPTDNNIHYFSSLVISHVDENEVFVSQLVTNSLQLEIHYPGYPTLDTSIP